MELLSRYLPWSSTIMTFINSDRHLEKYNTDTRPKIHSDRQQKKNNTEQNRWFFTLSQIFLFLSFFQPSSHLWHTTSSTHGAFLPYYWLLLPLLLFRRPWLWECFFQLSPANGTFNFYSSTGFHILTKVIIRRHWLWQGLFYSYFSF